MVITCAADCEHNNVISTCHFKKLASTGIERSKLLSILRNPEVDDSETYLCSCHSPIPSEENKILETYTKDLAFSLSGAESSKAEVQVLTVSSASEQSTKNLKRSDYIDWEEYFMSIALLSAKRSKDPVTQVGACLVNQNKIVVGIGYNGMPHGCDDDEFPWGKSSNSLESKHFYVCHAELNAILNTNCLDLSHCTLYTVLFPCNECTKTIIQARIKEIVYLSDKQKGKDSNLAAKKMFKAAQVQCRQFHPRRKNIELDFFNV